MSRGRFVLWGLVLGTVLLGSIAMFLGTEVRRVRTPAPLPPVVGKVPAFSLTNRDGRTITLASLAGKPWIADFIFTRCAGSCPLMTTRMARLEKELPGELHRVSITVDPAHDDPATLERYAQGVHAPPTWLFLTGPATELLSLCRDGFKLAVEVPAGAEVNAKEPILHSTRFVLVDRQGAIRGYYDGFDEGDMKRLAADWRALG